jgi:hypothetical protein
MMIPVGSPMATFGFKEILYTGIKNKTAVAGDKTIHFFIDKEGALYSLSGEGLQRYGYEEFLYPLVNPVMLLDSVKHLLYISDATTGYIFYQKSLGGGYVGLTGIKKSANTITAIAPEVIEVDSFEICTDSFDFGNRGLKHIDSVQFGIDTEEPLYAAIDYKYSLGDSFKTTNWIMLNKEGVAFIRIAGVEFRFRLKSVYYVDAELDYINIQMQQTDNRYNRGVRQYDNSATA